MFLALKVKIIYWANIYQCGVNKYGNKEFRKYRSGEIGAGY